MTINLKSLRKLESLPPSAQARDREENERVLVVVKLRTGAVPPPYVTTRSKFSDLMFSSEVSVADLQRLEADPAVASLTLSRPLAITR